MNSTYKGSVESLKDFWESRSGSFEKDYSIRSEGVSKVQKTEFIRFNAKFRVERYVKSDSELERLQKTSPSL
jgi:hypothetical protein